MKSLFILAALGCALTAEAQPADRAPVFAVNQRLGRGVNIIGYDALWENPAKARFQERHFRLIREAGFQSVRIVLQPFRHMDASGKLPDAWFKTLDWAVEKALVNGLLAIVDLHEFTTTAADPNGLKPKMIAFWQQVGAHFRNAPDSVVFELLNEPNGQITPAMWNQYLQEPLATIRATNPDRAVIIGPAFWNGITNLKDLVLPENDPNIILTVHYYHPMNFTHQGAPWVKESVNLKDIDWGAESEKAKVVNDFAMVQTWAKAHHRPVYLGEFGAYDKAPMAARVAYTAHLARTAELFGWSWGYWQFDSDFIVYDIDHDRWVEPIRNALIP